MHGLLHGHVGVTELFDALLKHSKQGGKLEASNLMYKSHLKVTSLVALLLYKLLLWLQELVDQVYDGLRDQHFSTESRLIEFLVLQIYDAFVGVPCNTLFFLQASICVTDGVANETIQLWITELMIGTVM